jgi:hypothetical protein
MQVIILSIILLALAIGGIAIKMFLVPEGTFTKTCGSTFDPHTGKPMPCSCASGNTDECHNTKEEKSHSSSDLIVNIKPNKG